MPGIVTRSKALALLTVLLSPCLSLPCLAAEELFLQDKPRSCMQAVNDAFLARRWKVVSKSEESITGSIRSRGRGIEATVTISYRENNFYYTGTALRDVLSNDWIDVHSNTDQQPTSIPDNWIENLKRDTTLFCARANSQKGSPSKAAPEDRLMKLQQLREKGLITEEEFQQQRQKIIDEI